MLSAHGVRVAVADLLEGASVVDVGRTLMRELAIDAKLVSAVADAGWEEGRL